MDARAWNRVAWLGLPMMALLSGCGNYTITFDVADVINAPGTDLSREMLDVDMICMTKKDAENHPEIVNGTMRANAWFKARDEDDPKIGDIGAKRIYALRRGSSGDKRDTLVGEPLLSFIDRNDGMRTTTVKVNHPEFLRSESALVIYGRFGNLDGKVANTAPLVIQPPPKWHTDLLIKVGRTGMKVAD
jgi:hypothetical protein